MPLNIEKIRALCFDVDGTLSDTDDMLVQILKRVLHPIRFLFRDHDAQRAARRFVMWSEAPGNYLYGIPDTLGMDDELFAMLEWFNRRHPRPMKHFLLISGVKEMLQTLSARYPLAVVSARDDKSTLNFLNQFGLTSFFQVIVTAQTAEHTKPYPDPLYHAAQAMGVPAEACLMVGDTTVDMRAGKQAGTQTVGVLCGFGEEKELRQYMADMILNTTAELVQVLAEGTPGTFGEK